MVWIRGITCNKINFYTFKQLSMRAKFYDSETLQQIFSLTNHKPINKYFWLKEVAEAVEKLSRDRNIPKTQILVEEVTK